MFTSTAEKIYMEGIEKGGREKAIETIMNGVIKVLDVRFKGQVPESILQAVRLYNDPIALESLFEQALTCESLAEFKRDLAHV